MFLHNHKFSHAARGKTSLEFLRCSRYNIFMSFNFNIVSVCFYAFWIFAIFIDGSGAKENSFNSDFLSLRATKSLQGLAAMGVICHHIAQINLTQHSGEIQIFRDIGFLFVGLFFFTSGFGLIKSIDTKPNYLNGFLKRRALPVFITYYVMNAFYIIWHLLLKTEFSTSQWICKILGISLLNDNAWFVPVILILYLAFYFIFKKIKNRKICFALIFIVIAVQVGWFLFNKHFVWWIGPENWWWNPQGHIDFSNAPWWQQIGELWFEGEWWVNSTICFLLGMLIAQNEKKFFEFFVKNYWMKFFALFSLVVISMWIGLWSLYGISYWREFGGDNSTLPRAQMFFIQSVQIILFVIFIIVFMMKFFADNKVTRFFGNYSLEIYLMQAIPLRQGAKFFDADKMDYSLVSTKLLVLLYVVLVIAISIIFALILKFISARIVKFLDKNKNV